MFNKHDELGRKDFLEESQGSLRAIVFYLVTNTRVKLNSRNPTAIDSQTLAANSGEFKETAPKGVAFQTNRGKGFDVIA